MALSIEQQPHNHISSLIKKTIFGAFTFLSALSIRDAITRTIEMQICQDIRSRLLYTYYYTVIVLAFTVFIAWIWGNTNN